MARQQGLDRMRDLLEDLFQGEALDPLEAARRSLRAPLRKRFYERAHVGDNFGIQLDGRPVMTPGGRPLALPTRALAEAIAEEWQAQTEVIDPGKMPLTRLANTIIDGVSERPQDVAAEIAKYLGSDLLVYRAQSPEGLVERQRRHWDPILNWARQALGAEFVLAENVTFVTQPPEAVARAAQAIPSNPWRLGPLHVITALTGSALIALAVDAGALSSDAASAAANVDEDWNLERWGNDELALGRRANHTRDLQAAAMMLRLAQ
jgi:chaperone required for assembly of F1-ATPase